MHHQNKNNLEMKIKEFKHEFSFNEWEKTHNPDKLYCISTPDMTQELFDVYEDDFIEMIEQGIVNGDGCYYLLGKPTEEDIKDYAKKYGIKWI